MSAADSPVIDVVDELQKLRLKAEELCELSLSRSTISGMPKLVRKCRAELQFVERLLKVPDTVSQSHLNSSNLAHLQGILQAVSVLPGVSQVLSPFRLPDLDHPIYVDVVCDHGRTWVKVIARNSKALLVDTTGQQAFGEKTILDQAKQFRKLAKHHLHNFSPPQITFLFFHDVPPKLVDTLEKVGINVIEREKLSSPQSCETFDVNASQHSTDSQLLPCSHSKLGDSFLNQTYKDSSEKSTSPLTATCDETSEGNSFGLKSFCSDDCVCAAYFSEKPQPPGKFPTVDPSVLEIDKVNLDITTLFALVSNLCHGNSQFVFHEKILTQQADEEVDRPLLPELLHFLRGKRLLVCETALHDFEKILSTVGGATEKERARLLLTQVTVVPDCPSKRSRNLRTTAKLSGRAKTIFGTGDSLRAVTTTANQGFARAAAQFSADFVVFVHGARALTEQKEASACPR